MGIMGETLIVDGANRNAAGRVLPIGVFIPEVQTKCDTCGRLIPQGTPVLRTMALKDGSVMCPSCIMQANATLMREWEERHPEGELSDLKECPKCHAMQVEVHVATAHKTVYDLLGDGDFEQVDAENYLEADQTAVVQCSACGHEYWAREAYWPLLG